MDRKHLFYGRIIGLLLALNVLVIDQFSKFACLIFLNDMSIKITNFFNLVLVWNPGVTFGMFKADTFFGVMSLVGFAAILSGFLFYLALKATTLKEILSYSLILGGAVGNIVDRLVHHAVVDFLDFHLFGWHWPAFNIADSAIVLGVFFVIQSNYKTKSA